MNPLSAPPDIHREIVDRNAGNCRFAVLVVVGASGSTPGRIAAKAIVHQDATLSGTIGGGAVEAQARRLALDALQTGQAVLVDFPMSGNSLDDNDPICGGAMRVLIDPHASQHHAAYTATVQARQYRQPGVLLTTIRGQNSVQTDVRFVSESGIAAEQDFPGPELLRQVLDRDRPLSVVAPEGSNDLRCEVLIEPLRPAPRLIIAGGGHVGQAVAQHALAVGFDVMVIDDRPDFANSERFAEQVEIRCGKIADQLARLPLDRDTYIVIVTRGHRDDAAALASCIGRPVAYLGMIGSRAKVRKIRDEFLRSARATTEDLDRIYAPIGLDLGAVTVPEIAVSIVAQLIAVRRRGTAPRL